MVLSGIGYLRVGNGLLVRYGLKDHLQKDILVKSIEIRSDIVYSCNYDGLRSFYNNRHDVLEIYEIPKAANRMKINSLHNDSNRHGSCYCHRGCVPCSFCTGANYCEYCDIITWQDECPDCERGLMDYYNNKRVDKKIND